MLLNHIHEDDKTLEKCFNSGDFDLSLTYFKLI